MNKLKDYVDFRLTHSDKLADADGYPLELSDCKKHKPMRDLKIYGNSYQGGTPSPETPIEVQSVGELVTDEADVNFGKYKIPVVQRGINLFDISKFNATAQTINGITFTPLDDERVHIKGKLEDTTKPANYQIGRKGVFSISKGTYKTKRSKYINNGLQVGFNISNTVDSINIFDNATSVNVTFNNPFINFAQLYVRAGTTIEFDDVIELQLLKGAEDFPYEPYVEPIKTNIFLNEPLRKLGDYADYVDFKENKVVRNVRELVFKGGEIDNVYTGYTNLGYNLYRTKDNFVNNAYVKNLDPWLSVYPEKSTHFIANTFRASQDVKINQWTIKTAYALNFTLAPETYASNGVSATAKDINNWLSSQYENGTPVTFYYILKEPTQEPISLNFPKLTAKTTIIEVDTSLAPSNAYGKYIKK